MKVEVHIDPGCGETRLTVTAPALTDEVRALVRRLSGPAAGVLTGWRGDVAACLEAGDLLRCYARNKEVCAQTAAGEWLLKERLYELEQKLDPARFVRISHSEIVNLKKVERLDLSLTGTIKMTLAGGVTTYVSRRYVKKIKEALGLRRGGQS